MGHGTFSSNNIYFFLITKLIEYRKKLVKITAKGKTDISDFKLECDKILIMKFCYRGSNFRRKF